MGKGIQKVKIVGLSGGAMPSTSPDLEQREQAYKDERDHETLQRAEEVRGDPKRMAGAARHHRKKLGEMAAVGETLAGKQTMGDKKRPSKFRMASGRARSGR